MTSPQDLATLGAGAAALCAVVVAIVASAIGFAAGARAARRRETRDRIGWLVDVEACADERAARATASWLLARQFELRAEVALGRPVVDLVRDLELARIRRHLAAAREREAAGAVASP